MSEIILTSAFKRWRNHFLRQAMRILPSESDAEDALQDAFIKLWPKAGKIDTEQDAVALASVTIRNISIDKYRNTKRSNVVDIEGYETDDDSGFESDLIEKKIDVIEKIMNRCLTKSQTEIIRMRDYEGRSYDEIGLLLNLKPTAIRMQLSRARKAIREEYRKLNEG